MDSAQSDSIHPLSFTSTPASTNMQRDHLEPDSPSFYPINTNTNISHGNGYSYVGGPLTPLGAALGDYEYNILNTQASTTAQNQHGPIGTTQYYMPTTSSGLNLYQPLPLGGDYSHLEDTSSYQQFPATQFDEPPVSSYGNFTGVNGTPPYPSSDEFDTQYADDDESDQGMMSFQQNYSRCSPLPSYIHGFHSESSQLPGSSDTSHADATALTDTDDSYNSLSSSKNKRKIAQPRSRRPVENTFTPPCSTASLTPPMQHAAIPASTSSAPRLLYKGFADAEAAAYDRSRLNITHDDWQQIKNNPADHVQKLVAAFSLPYGDEPEEYQQLTQTDKERWIAYQEAHMDKMSKFSPDKIEAASWCLLKDIIEAHELGVKSIRYHRSDYIEKCSSHVERIAEAIAFYAVIRYDVVRLQRFDELVSSTHSAVQRKISNFKGNWGKTKRELENDERAKQAGFEYKKVLGEKKRKAAEEVSQPKPKRGKRKADDLVERICATVEGAEPPAKKARSQKAVAAPGEQ